MENWFITIFSLFLAFRRLLQNLSPFIFCLLWLVANFSGWCGIQTSWGGGRYSPPSRRVKVWLVYGSGVTARSEDKKYLLDRKWLWTFWPSSFTSIKKHSFKSIFTCFFQANLVSIDFDCLGKSFDIDSWSWFHYLEQVIRLSISISTRDWSCSSCSRWMR